MENERLRMENEALRKENLGLRAELARLRLYHDLDRTDEGLELPSALPDDARKLYRVLPWTFGQIEYFRMAKDLGYSLERAQALMGLFFREHLLLRNEDGLEKVNRLQIRLPLFD